MPSCPNCNAPLSDNWTRCGMCRHRRTPQEDQDPALIPDPEGKQLASCRLQLDGVTAHRDALQKTFDLRWNADRRAIKRWQEAHPGNELTWPDHADLVVWLMEQVDNANQPEHPKQES